MDSADPKKMGGIPGQNEPEFNAKSDNVPVDVTAEKSDSRSTQSHGDRKRKRFGNDNPKFGARNKRNDTGHGKHEYVTRH